MNKLNMRCHCVQCDPIISVEVLRIHRRLHQAIAELQRHIVYVDNQPQAQALEVKITGLTQQLQILGRTPLASCQEAGYTKP